MEPPLNMNLLRRLGSQGTIEVVPDELPQCKILPLLKIIFYSCASNNTAISTVGLNVWGLRCHPTKTKWQHSALGCRPHCCSGSLSLLPLKRATGQLLCINMDVSPRWDACQCKVSQQASTKGLSYCRELVENLGLE
jgi:hypothetical protein